MACTRAPPHEAGRSRLELRLAEMERRKARYGLVSMCIGGGMGAAGVLVRLS